MTLSPRMQLCLARAYGRGPLRLSDLRDTMGLKYGPDPESYSSYPEKRYFTDSAGKSTLATVAKHGNAATDPKTYAHEKAAEMAGGVGQQFKTAVPTTNTVEQVARLGVPARGEYKKTYVTVHDLFGHDPHGVAAWVGINAALSPNAAYPDHASAATHLTAKWLALPGRLREDPETIRRLMHEANVFGKEGTDEVIAAHPGAIKGDFTIPYGQSFSGPVAARAGVKRVINVLQNIDKIKLAMERPELPESGQWLGLLSGQGPVAGMLKVPNFFSSYGSQNFGAAIDTHMNRLLIHPMLGGFMRQSPIMQQLERLYHDGEDVGGLRAEVRRRTPIKSELVKAMMQHPDLKIPAGKTLADGTKERITIPAFAKIINAKLSEKPAYYAAYKHVLADAADKLGWNLSEVQESVWTGLIGLMAMNSVARDPKFKGIPQGEIEKHLNADAIRQGWQNHEFFLFPSVVDAYRRAGTDPNAVRRVEQWAAEAAAANSRPGILSAGLTPGLREIAAHLPASSRRAGVDAASPVRQAIVKSLQTHGVIDANGKVKLQRLGQRLRLKMLLAKDIYGRDVDFANDHDVRNLVQGYLENAKDMAYPLILSDRLEELGHPHAEMLRWYIQHGLPAHKVAYENLEPLAHNNVVQDVVPAQHLQPLGQARSVMRTNEPAQTRFDRVLSAVPEPLSRLLQSAILRNVSVHTQHNYASGHPPVVSNMTDNRHRKLAATLEMQSLGLLPNQRPYDPAQTRLFLNNKLGNFFRDPPTIGNPDHDKSFERAADAAEQFVGSHAQHFGTPEQQVQQKFQRPNTPARLTAQYDAPLPLAGVLTRITAANHKTFVDHLRTVLAQSGVIPQEVLPAIHDVGGAARASVFATGSFRNPNAPGTAAAWTGMLGRQPGMLAFRSSPNGPDSVYKFQHGDTDAIQQVLSANGVNSRVIVPQGKAFQVYVYDKGRAKREAVARAVSQLGTAAEEWQGQGTSIGGNHAAEKDMGREQYRNVINTAESGGTVQ